jgi:hypothetical protein
VTLAKKGRFETERLLPVSESEDSTCPPGPRPVGLVAHAHADNPDLLHAGRLGEVDHRDDVAVVRRGVPDNERGLVLARLGDIAQLTFEGQDHRLVVDGNGLVHPVLEPTSRASAAFAKLYQVSAATTTQRPSSRRRLP